MMNGIKKLYLAGPMRGYPQYNFPAFTAAAKQLRDRGYFVFSPHEKDIELHGEAAFNGSVDRQGEVASNAGFSLRAAFKLDADFICDEADGVALLAGWETSRGARAESAIAVAIGVPRFTQAWGGWEEVGADGRLTGRFL